MTEFLTKQAPKEIGGQNLDEISQRDGVKYIMADDSWLLIRPPGPSLSCGSMPREGHRKWSKRCWDMENR